LYSLTVRKNGLNMKNSVDAGQSKITRDRFNLSCPICGANLYPTNQLTNVIIFHCSSPKAKFWEYLRGTGDLLQAKKHWDLSKKELSLG
jgi:hypothetical protein